MFYHYHYACGTTKTPTYTIRDGKGEQDSVTIVPESLIDPLQEYVRNIKRLHEEDRASGILVAVTHSSLC